MVNALTTLWTSLITWLTTSLTSLGSIFYVNEEFTIFGVIAGVTVGLGIILLIFNKVFDMFRLRG